MRRRRRSTASSAAAIAAGTPKTSAVLQCWREVRARIDSRPVPRICIVSVAMTTATGQPPELHRPLPAELLVTDAAHRLAMIAAARALARGAMNAWGMTYLFVNSASCTSLLDRSQQRPAYGTRSSSRRRRDICTSWQWRPRRRWATTRPRTSGASDGRRRAGVPFTQHGRWPNSASYVKSTSILRQTVMGIHDRRASRRTRQRHRRRLRGRPARRATKDAPPRGVARHLTRLPAS